jgi:hypothetical protein
MVVRSQSLRVLSTRKNILKRDGKSYIYLLFFTPAAGNDVLGVSGHGKAGDEVAVTLKCSVGLSDFSVDNFAFGASDFFGIF